MVVFDMVIASTPYKMAGMVHSSQKRYTTWALSWPTLDYHMMVCAYFLADKIMEISLSFIKLLPLTWMATPKYFAEIAASKSGADLTQTKPHFVAKLWEELFSQLLVSFSWLCKIYGWS